MTYPIEKVMRVTSVEDCISSLTHLIIPKVTTEGSYYESVEAKKCPKDNFTSVNSKHNGGNFGYLGEIMGIVMYNTTKLGQDFSIIPDTVTPMVIAVGTTAIVSGNSFYQYNKSLCKWI